MTVESEFGDDSFARDYGTWLLESGLWDGRPIAWQNRADFQHEVARKMARILFSNDESADKMAAYLAWIGARPEEKLLIARDIFSFRISSAGIAVLAKHKHKHKKGFFEKYKTQILIGLGVAALVAAVATAILLTGGAVAGEVVALAAAAIDGLTGSKKDEPPPGPILAPTFESPTLRSENLDGSIPKFETPVDSPPHSNPFLDVPTVSSLHPLAPLFSPAAAESPYQIQYLENGMRIGNEFKTYSEILAWTQRELHYVPADLESLVRKPPVPQPIPEYRPDPFAGHYTPPQALPPVLSHLWDFLGTIGTELNDPEIRDPHNPLIKYPERCHRFETGGIKHSQCRIGWINGMGNCKEEGIDNANHLSALAGGLNIEAVYNSSHGVAVDLAEIAALNYQGLSPRTSTLLSEIWNDFHEKNKEKPHLKFLQFCHSQGAIHVKNTLLNSPQEIRDRIIVVAIAPADIVTKDLCFDSFNFASKRDLVPYAKVAHSFVFKSAKSKLEAIREHKELILLDPHPEAPWYDHGWQSPTFKEKIQWVVRKYVDCNGEYNAKN